MAQKVYKLFMGKAKEAWYQLSQEEQDALLAKNAENLKKLGAKTDVVCNSTWSSEQWQFFGVEVFPNIEASQKHTAYLNQLDWLRYTESITMLGSEWQGS